MVENNAIKPSRYCRAYQHVDASKYNIREMEICYKKWLLVA